MDAHPLPIGGNGAARRTARAEPAGGRLIASRRAVPAAYLGLLAGFGAGLLVLADRAAGRLVEPSFTPLVGATGTRSVLSRGEFRMAVRTNAAGFRGPELPTTKPPGVFRIVVLGDSFTWGYGVRERQAYPARLERRLNARLAGSGSRRIEVVNLGLPGTGPLDHLYHLRTTGLALRPDLVLVGLFANDVNDLYQLRRFGTRSPFFALPSLRRAVAAPLPWWKRLTVAALPNLYALASRVTARLPARAGEARAESPAPPSTLDPGSIVAALGERYGERAALLRRYRVLAADDRAAVDRLIRGEPLGDDRRPALLVGALVDPDGVADGILLRSPGRAEALTQTMDVLAEIVHLAASHGADTMLAVLPAAEEVDRSRWPVLAAAGYRLDPAMLGDTRLPDTVRALATREGASMVDLLATFRRRGAGGRYFVVDEHWNARGQALAASRLAAALAPHIRVTSSP